MDNQPFPGLLNRQKKNINYFPDSCDNCCLLITMANCLVLDRARQNVGPELEPKFLTHMYGFREILFLNSNIFFKPEGDKKACKQSQV